MTGRGNHFDLEKSEGELVAVLNGTVKCRDFALLSLWSDDADAEFGFQRLVAFDVIKVMMRRENEVERPATALERRFDCVRIRRVDCRGQLTFRIMDENAIIIAAADELFDIESFVDLGHGVLHFHAFVIRPAPNSYSFGFHHVLIHSAFASGKVCFWISGICESVKTMVIGMMPQTLKETQASVEKLRHTTSLAIAGR